MTLRQSIQNWFMKDSYANCWSLAVGICAFLILCNLIPAQGLTDDDDFYAPAGISYFNWFQDLVTQPSHALEQVHIDRAFKINREHPPMAKWSIGFFEWFLHQKLGLLKSLDGARAGVSFLAALLAAFMFRLLFSYGGISVALFGVLSLFSLPRFLFHSQVATLDVPVSSFIVMTTIAFFWSLRNKTWTWGVGILFGMALATKLNAPFMAFGFVLYWAITQWREFQLNEKGSHLSLPSMPNAFWSMLLLGPCLFFISWPYLWNDTIARLGKYIAFHMNHYPILLFYQGTLHLEPYAPWHMPFMMALGTIPLPLLCMGGFGILCAFHSLFRLLKQSTTEPTARDQLLVIVLIQMLIAIFIVAFSNVPKYGGEKLFMPFFPLFCLIAALGFSTFLKLMTSVFPKIKALLAHPANVLFLVLFVLGPGFIGSYHFHGGYALSYYSEFLGGLRGATAQGYERTYYDVADKSLAQWLDKNVPAQNKVHFEPNHKEYKRTYKWLQKDGYISTNLQLSSKWNNSQYIVLSHERRWRSYSQLLDKVAPLEKVYEKAIDGVPLYTVYKK